MRKAFKISAIARISRRELLAEALYLEKQPHSGGVEGDVAGGNFESHSGDRLTLGGTYLLVDANIPDADELDVYSGRANGIPLTGLTLSGEYAYQKSDQIQADGRCAHAAYEAKSLSWSPVFSYRYATFDGDNPNTTDRNENFRSIAYGYTNYGSRYQGEITGNYPLGNNNLTSHLLRAKMQPGEKVTLKLMYYNFLLDEPATLGAGATSDDWGDELNFISTGRRPTRSMSLVSSVCCFQARLPSSGSAATITGCTPCSTLPMSFKLPGRLQVGAMSHRIVLL